MRVGGEEERHSDFRLICATNKDLWAEVKSGHFREDLYYRLSVVPLTIPPLRSRKEDIRLLVRFFLDRYSRRYHRDIQQPSERELEALLQYDWPGNIRELKSVLERTVILHQGAASPLTSAPTPKAKRTELPARNPVRSSSRTFRRSTNCRAGIFSMCSRSPTGASPGTGGRCAFWA